MCQKRLAIFAFLLYSAASIDADGEHKRFDTAVEYLARDLILRWSFPSDNEVTFEYWIPVADFDFYGWAGLAIQDPRDARDHFKCDYYIAILHDVEEPQLTDRYAEVNGLAPLDTEQGGTDDVVSWSEINEDFLVIYMTRPLVNDDAFDIDIPKGKPILIKWALGQLMEGEIQQHDLRDMGFEYLVLSEEYMDNNEDERGVFGPWWEVHPQDQKWNDNYGSPTDPATTPALESTYHNTPI